ncbi:MAG: hypothetical protein DHS20C13_29040 [Thermodesulfobacteriota bacterium]|nr:MAG: hypothetical protein DHS20C13_29040 [Thermodesulfobacteriota bacterium]
MTGEYCCAAGKYFNVTNETCEDLPDDCLWWDYHDDLCGECDTGNYMNPEENECCSYAEYHNGTDCVAIEEPNCERYYHGRCQRCLDDYFLTENHHCHKITAILNRCDEFDVFEKKCKKCIAESNKYGHYCCEWNELFSHVTGECGAIAEEDLFDNCDNTVEVGEDEYECRKCSATFYPFEFGGTEHCCPKGTYKMDSGDCVVIESENCGYFDVTNDECFTCIDSTFDRVY